MQNGNARKARRADRKEGEIMGDVKLYTVKELAAILKVHYQTALAYCETGKILARKVEGRWIVTDDSLRAFVEPAAAHG